MPELVYPCDEAPASSGRSDFKFEMRKEGDKVHSKDMKKGLWGLRSRILLVIKVILPSQGCSQGSDPWWNSTEDVGSLFPD